MLYSNVIRKTGKTADGVLRVVFGPHAFRVVCNLGFRSLEYRGLGFRGLGFRV